MAKNFIVLTNWKGKKNYTDFATTIANNLSGNHSIIFLFLVADKVKPEDLPALPQVHYLSKKDFSFLGKCKNQQIQQLLKQPNNILICSVKTTTPLLKKTLKISTLKSVGIKNEKLPLFTIAFSNTSVEDGNLFKKINNYIAKIKL